MLNRFKTALYNVVGSFDPGDGGTLGGLGPGVTSGLPTSAVTGRALTGSSKDRVNMFFSLTFLPFLVESQVTIADYFSSSSPFTPPQLLFSTLHWVCVFLHACVTLVIHNKFLVYTFTSHFGCYDIFLAYTKTPSL